MVSLKELLHNAKLGGYGVGAFNITSITYIDAQAALFSQQLVQRCSSPAVRLEECGFNGESKNLSHTHTDTRAHSCC